MIARKTLILILSVLLVSSIAVAPVAGTSIKPIDEVIDDDTQNASDAPIQPTDCDDYFQFSGWFHHGQTVLYVTHNGSVVENATVFVEGDRVGKTNAEGAIHIPFPEEFVFEVVAVKDGHASGADMMLGGFKIVPADDCEAVSA